MTRKRAPEEWTPEVVSRLWGHFANDPRRQAEYFSRQVGTGIVSLLKFAGRSGGVALDFGCGPGFLAQQLLAAGFQCQGLDTSDRSVATANERCRTWPNWLGAAPMKGLPTTLGESSFDVICCIETLEHVADAELEGVILEVRRLLKPGATALVTVPNEEDRNRNMTYCPFCDTEFHSMQHLRSFSQQTLTSRLKAAGLEVVFCRNLDLERFQRGRWAVICPPEGLRLRGLARWGRAHLLDVLMPRPFPSIRRFKLLASPGPHLCALAVRPT